MSRSRTPPNARMESRRRMTKSSDLCPSFASTSLIALPRARKKKMLSKTMNGSQHAHEYERKCMGMHKSSSAER